MSKLNRISVTDDIQTNARLLIRNSQRWYLEEVLDLKGDEYQEIYNVALGNHEMINEDLNNRIEAYLQKPKR
ncbi:hypothetical protein MUP37_01680 [Candidatus Bathyarchaeota archaeon]|nr:hypothetical protein [Candidatus Bathyarchaeota archaeon]